MVFIASKRLSSGMVGKYITYWRMKKAILNTIKLKNDSIVDKYVLIQNNYVLSLEHDILSTFLNQYSSLISVLK